VLEDISYQSPEIDGKQVKIDGNYVRGRLMDILQQEDLSKFIL
jgi:ATP-dependent HslUV protease ATP-binding subunit HslU